MDKEKLLTIGRPQRLCMNCNERIDAVERHPSAVKLGREQIERYDYCPQCWEHIKGEVFDSFWLTRREPRQKRMPKLTRRQRNAAMRALFESLRERCENEDVGPHLFLLSHLLMKWGGLKWRENRPTVDGGEVVVFEDPASGELYEVPSVEIDDESLALIKLEIEELLKQFASDEEDISL